MQNQKIRVVYFQRTYNVAAESIDDSWQLLKTSDLAPSTSHRKFHLLLLTCLEKKNWRLKMDLGKFYVSGEEQRWQYTSYATPNHSLHVPHARATAVCEPLLRQGCRILGDSQYITSFEFLPAPAVLMAKADLMFVDYCSREKQHVVLCYSES